MGNKIYAAVALGALMFGVFLQIQIHKQNEVINAGLTTIALNQVQLVAGQAAGNATLSMLHTTGLDSLALQQKAAGKGQEVRQ